MMTPRSANKSLLESTTAQKGKEKAMMQRKVRAPVQFKHKDPLPFDEYWLEERFRQCSRQFMHTCVEEFFAWSRFFTLSAKFIKTDMNMAVVPAGPRVDYSVTKGGLRLWAVVFIFIILCACIYSVFQNTQMEFDMDDEFDIDDDVDQTNDEATLAKRKQHEIHHHNKGNKKIDDDDEEEIYGVRSRALEELMLMELEEKWQRLRGVHKLNENDDQMPIIDDDDDDGDEEDDNDEDDDDEDDEPTIQRPKRNPDPVVEDDDDDDDDHDDDDEENDDDNEQDDDDDNEQDDEDDDCEKEENPRKAEHRPTTPKARRQLIRISLQREDIRKNDLNKIKVHRPQKPIKPPVQQPPTSSDETSDDSDEAPEPVVFAPRTKKTPRMTRIKPVTIVDDRREIKPSSIRVKRSSGRIAKAAKAIEQDKDEDETHQDDTDQDAHEDVDQNDDDRSPVEKAIERLSQKRERPKAHKKKAEPKKAKFIRVNVPKTNDSDDDDDDDDANKPTTSRVRTLPNTKRVDIQERIEVYDAFDDSLHSTNVRMKKSVKGSIAHSPYKKADVTSHKDRQIKDQLDEADKLLDQNQVANALKAYNRILTTHTDSARAQYGKARCIDHISHEQQSNELLEDAIDEYAKVLDNPDTPLSLFKITGEKAIERCRFRGYFQRALKLHKVITDKLPGNIEQLNSFGVTYLMMNDYTNAKKIFKTVLARDSDDGYALVRYGFCLKVGDRNLEEGYKYLKAGIDTGETGTQDARFYYHMGDAMQRLGLVKQNPHAPPSASTSKKRS